MSFNKNADKFNGQKVIDYSEKDGIKNIEIAYRIRINWEDVMDASKLFEAFLKDPKISEVKNIVFGHWHEEAYDIPADDIIKLLLDNKAKLQQLKGIFFGDITYEENEVSWIRNTDHGKIINAFPNLTEYKVRGGMDLSLKNLNHTKLKKLVVETGGMGNNIFQEIVDAKLPNLEHLELWSGSDDYGFDASAEQMVAVYKKDNFPKLKYLGFRNCEISDDIANLMINDPILDQIDELDFSKGTFGDEGAEAILKNPKILHLKKLNIQHNFISDKLAKKLEALELDIDLSDRNPNPDEYDRYVCVGE